MTSERNEVAARFGRLACEAGHAIMRVRAAGVVATEKGDGSPVTQADLEADRHIRAGLAAALPGVAIVTEEDADSHSWQEMDQFILVDPLDGTREFTTGGVEFTVNIALIEKGVPIVGAIYAPALQDLYVAADRAWHAKVASAAAMPEVSAMQPLSAAPVPTDAWRAVASRSHLDAETRAWLDAQPIGEFCAAGSSLKFCAIAEGRADVYPRLAPTMQWDTAAGHAILLAAGGSVEMIDGAPLRYGRGEHGYKNPSFIAWGAK